MALDGRAGQICGVALLELAAALTTPDSGAPVGLANAWVHWKVFPKAGFTHEDEPSLLDGKTVRTRMRQHWYHQVRFWTSGFRIEDLPLPTAVFPQNEVEGCSDWDSYVLRFQRVPQLPLELVAQSLLAFEGRPEGRPFDLFDLAGGHLTVSPTVRPYTWR